MKINNLEEQEVNDIIEKENIDLSSFKIKDELNPKIFDREQQMYKDVRTRLLMIADDFFETSDIGWVEIDDIMAEQTVYTLYKQRTLTLTIILIVLPQETKLKQTLMIQLLSFL